MTHREIAQRIVMQTDEDRAEFLKLLHSRQKAAAEAFRESGTVPAIHAPFHEAKIDQTESLLKRLLPVLPVLALLCGCSATTAVTVQKVLPDGTTVGVQTVVK